MRSENSSTTSGRSIIWCTRQERTCPSGHWSAPTWVAPGLASKFATGARSRPDPDVDRVVCERHEGKTRRQVQVAQVLRYLVECPEMNEGVVPAAPRHPVDGEQVTAKRRRQAQPEALLEDLEVAVRERWPAGQTGYAPPLCEVLYGVGDHPAKDSVSSSHRAGGSPTRASDRCSQRPVERPTPAVRFRRSRRVAATPPARRSPPPGRASARSSAVPAASAARWGPPAHALPTR